MKKTLHLFFCVVLFALISSCKKDDNDSFDPYFQFKLNGVQKEIPVCATGDFTAQYINDTAVRISIACDTFSVYLYLNDDIIGDNTTSLNVREFRYYEPSVEYETSDFPHTELTIKTKELRLNGWGVTGTAKAEFLFTGIDANTGSAINVTDGKFLLRKR